MENAYRTIPSDSQRSGKSLNSRWIIPCESWNENVRNRCWLYTHRVDCEKL